MADGGGGGRKAESRNLAPPHMHVHIMVLSFRQPIVAPGQWHPPAPAAAMLPVVAMVSALLLPLRLLTGLQGQQAAQGGCR